MSAAKALIAGLEAVTKDWARQRRAEERDRRAHLARRDRMIRTRRWTIAAAAYAVMHRSYAKASGDGRYPTKARQVMYAARPLILQMTARDNLNDAYFTQMLLPDYVEEHPETCSGWDIVWDARGHLREPHTGLTVPLGTLEVRRYLTLHAAGPKRPSAVDGLTAGIERRYPTVGPRNRYKNILFVEKEGFDPIIEAARIQERFDVTLMSTKGMSVSAARMLLDHLAPIIDNVFVLRDLDVAGFSIFGTLGSDSRRYRFTNRVKLIDLGLRLADVEAMRLESEPVERFADAEWAKRRITLERHGATPLERNPGSASSLLPLPGANSTGKGPGIGVYIHYDTNSCCSGSGHPPSDIVISGNRFRLNGGAVAGCGVELDGSLATGGDLIDSVSIHGNVFDQNMNRGICAYSTKGLKRISVGANSFIGGTAQRTNIDNNIRILSRQ